MAYNFDRYNAPAFKFNIERIPEGNAYALTTVRTFTRNDLSPDQTHVYDSIIAWHGDPNARQYLKVGGLAGTGKTTLVSALAQELESQGVCVVYAAFTGKAVNVMGKKLRAAGVHGQCMTLHSLMYRPKVDGNGQIEGWEKVESLPAELVVVDEASMVGRELWEDLLSYGLPILAVGDHGQLPPIGDSVVNLMLEPDLKLEQIHRQAQGNPILALAQHVRLGNSHYQYEPTDDRVSFVPSFAAVAENVAAAPNEVAAICYTNKTRVAINNMVRRGLGRALKDPFPGDTVICLRNKKPIFNGMRGRLGLIDASGKDDSAGAVIDFEDDGLRLTSKVYLPQFNNPKTFDKIDGPDGKSKSINSVGMLFDYGYALTAHKAQGSQFREVVLVYEDAFRGDKDLRNRWMYTAVTRASERLYVVRP